MSGQASEVTNGVELSNEQWMQVFHDGEWIPHIAIADNAKLRGDMWEYRILYSVARDAYKKHNNQAPYACSYLAVGEIRL